MRPEYESPWYLGGPPAAFVEQGPGVEYAGAGYPGEEPGYGWVQILAQAAPAIISAVPLLLEGAKAVSPAPRPPPRGRAPQPARPRARPPAPAAPKPPELVYLEAVAARDPARFRDALRQMAASPSPVTPTVGASDMPQIIYGDDGQAYEVLGGTRPPPNFVDVDIDFDWFRRFFGPGAGMPPAARPPLPMPTRRAAPPVRGRRGPGPLPGWLRSAVARHARIPPHAAAMLAIIRGADGRPKVGYDDGFGGVEVADLDDVLSGEAVDVEALGEADFGADDGADFGRVGDPMGAREILQFLRFQSRAQRVGRQLEFRSWRQGTQDIRDDLRVPTGRSPAPTGELIKIPLYGAVNTNPRVTLTVPGGSAGAMVNAQTLTTRAYNYMRYRIVGLETNFGDRSSGAIVGVRYLRVTGADINLIPNDSAAYSDADDWSSDIESSPGLRTGEGTVVDLNGTASVEVAIAGDDADTAVGTVKLIAEVLRDVVSTQRTYPVGGR